MSVVVPTHDRPDYLRQALASIRALDGPDIDFEIIVAEDTVGSRTGLIAGEFGARLVRASNRGAAASRNAGLRAATGEYLAFLDDDDVWLPGHLRPHLALLKAQPRLRAAISQVRNADPTLTNLGPAWPVHVSASEDVFHAFYTFFPQIGATVARASILDSVGFQNESLLGSEDWDWHLRLALKHPIGFIPVPSVGYRTRPPGADDELILLRVREHRHVFWSRAWHAGRRSPSPLALLRAWSRHRGRFASYLIGSAEARLAAGDVPGARRALRRAFGASPPHCVRLLLGRPGLRRLMAPAGPLIEGVGPPA
ncbi:MAG TPA: glycosyltransferase family A protein [Candidatus Dormibacteraeota bacterium]